MTLADLNRLLAPLRTRLANMLGRAVVRLVSDAGKMQTLQVELLEGEAREACERFQAYGFTSVPLAGAEALVLFLGGHRDHPIAVAVDDRRYRKTGLAAGEVALYHKDGAIVHLKADGSIELTPKAGQSIVLAGGTKNVALADHSHSIAALTDSHGAACGGTLGASNSNATKVKAG